MAEMCNKVLRVSFMEMYCLRPKGHEVAQSRLEFDIPQQHEFHVLLSDQMLELFNAQEVIQSGRG